MSFCFADAPSARTHSVRGARGIGFAYPAQSSGRLRADGKRGYIRRRRNSRSTLRCALFFVAPPVISPIHRAPKGRGEWVTPCEPTAIAVVLRTCFAYREAPAEQSALAHSCEHGLASLDYLPKAKFVYLLGMIVSTFFERRVSKQDNEKVTAFRNQRNAVTFRFSAGLSRHVVWQRKAFGMTRLVLFP